MEVDASNMRRKNEGARARGSQPTSAVDLTTPRATPTARSKAKGYPVPPLELPEGATSASVENEVEELMKTGALTLEEAKSLVKSRAKKVAAGNKRAQTAALTGWSADYPSLSHYWSGEVAINMVHSMKSRMVTFLWKKLCWQLRVKEAVRQESQGRAKWRKNPRWLSEMLGREVAALYGHFGAMRQRLRAPDVQNLM